MLIEWPIKSKRISTRYASFGAVLLFAKNNRRQQLAKVLSDSREKSLFPSRNFVSFLAVSFPNLAPFSFI